MLMQSALPLADLENPPNSCPATSASAPKTKPMLSAMGAASRRALIDGIVPRSIARTRAMELPAPVTEAAALAELKAIAQNQMLRSFIGQGYYGTHTPGVILRNILENPAWYTAYTPYQAEISQGRMEALVNFQTMVTDLTGMPIANASMLDEATAAAEAMTLAKRSVKSKATPSGGRRLPPADHRGHPDPRRAAGPGGGGHHQRAEWAAALAERLLRRRCPVPRHQRLVRDCAPTCNRPMPSRPPSSWPPTCWP
jgi:hypothetical protein